MISIKVFHFLLAAILWIQFEVYLCKEASSTTTRLKGQICAYGDMDRDLNTDLIVQHGHLLKIYLQVSILLEIKKKSI